jgi:hypothetical protein
VDARVHERLFLEACDMDGVGGSGGVAALALKLVTRPGAGRRPVNVAAGTSRRDYRIALQPRQTSSEKPRSTSAAEWPPRTPQLSSAGSRITTETSVGSMAISPSLWTRVR